MSRKPKNIPPKVTEAPTEETILPTEEETPVEEVQVTEAPTEEPLEIFKNNFEKVVEAEKEKANSFMEAWNKIVEIRS